MIIDDLESEDSDQYIHATGMVFLIFFYVVAY
jgi:hypothetical protein